MLTIDHFSDVLCVWAYGGQVRLDELRTRFGDQIVVRERFTSLFADTQSKIGDGWRERGGFEGFGRHTQEVCEQWPHAHPAPAIWQDCRPPGSASTHLFLRAYALALGIDDDTAPGEQRTQFSHFVFRVRCAFFEHALDIARFDVLASLLDETDPSAESIRSRTDSGEAAAMLFRDAELARIHGVRGSPTYLFNEGRQMLYGNVGYRIIEANILELLSDKLREGEPSWC